MCNLEISELPVDVGFERDDFEGFLQYTQHAQLHEPCEIDELHRHQK